jgi:hypothetical protein|eukprot:COSAG06_NODE_5074_length_3745_cov_2.533461_2_plen_354_part_00
MSFDVSSPVGPERLKMSELMERARALGAPNDVIDECMDQPEVRLSALSRAVFKKSQPAPSASDPLTRRARVPQPRAALMAMLRAADAPSPTPSDDASFTGQLRDRAQALAAELADTDQRAAADVVATMHAMLELCGSAEADAEAEGAALVVTPEHELAAAGVVEACAQMLHASLPTGDTPREAFRDTVDERPPVTQAATLLLSTLAAKQDAHAWFGGSGAIPALVAALSYGLGLTAALEHDATKRLLPPESHGGDGAVEPLAASSLANLACHDGVEGASTAVVKEILRVGAVAPLLATLSRGHLRSQQWAAAALCNLSMHGDRAREELAGKPAVLPFSTALIKAAPSLATAAT